MYVIDIVNKYIVQILLQHFWLCADDSTVEYKYVEPISVPYASLYDMFTLGSSDDKVNCSIKHCSC